MIQISVQRAPEQAEMPQARWVPVVAVGHRVVLAEPVTLARALHRWEEAELRIVVSQELGRQGLRTGAPSESATMAGLSCSPP